MHDILLPPNRLIRLRNSFRYPFQSAMLARTPIAGTRVPLRDFWRRQPLRMTWRSERALDRAMGAASRTGAWCSTAALASASAARAAGMRARTAARGATRFDRRALPPLAMGAAAGAAAGAAVGALVMYLADPHAGRRRRALMRDRVVHIGHTVTRRLPSRVERRMRFIRGVASGVRHDAAALVRVDGGHEAFPDDETLVARVRSEVLRNRHVKAGEIHIDAYEGIVTLRGQADSHEISDLVTATTRVEGVRGVRNYLHTPGSLPPNKAEGYAPHPMATDGG